MGKKLRRSIRNGVWSAAVCVDARTAAGLIRESLEGLGYGYTRDMADRPFTKFMLIVPWPKFAYVFQFKVHSPSEFLVNIFDTQPTTSGNVHMIEVRGVTPSSVRGVVRLMRRFRRRLGRKPWDFDRAGRMQTGFLLSEFTSARRRWRAVGVV